MSQDLVAWYHGVYYFMLYLVRRVDGVLNAWRIGSCRLRNNDCDYALKRLQLSTIPAQMLCAPRLLHIAIQSEHQGK